MPQHIPKLHVVYDFKDQAVLHSSVYFIYLITVAAFLMYYLMRHNRYANPFLLKIKRVSLWMTIMALALSLLITANELKAYFETKSIYDGKAYSIVEGRVQGYKPLSAGGHDSEDFKVDSLYFSLNDDDIDIIGYNKAASQGGIIRPNLYVRIYYPTYGKIGILRLETE